MDARSEYAVTAREDGSWWLVEIPELDTAGQASTRAQVGEVAREVIELRIDAAPDTYDVFVGAEAGPRPQRTPGGPAR